MYCTSKKTKSILPYIGFRREALSRHMGIIGIKVYQLAVLVKETNSLGNLMKSPSIIFILVYQDNFLSHGQSHCC
jgi:hypothetical protein